MESASGLNLVLGIGVHAASYESELLRCPPAEGIVRFEYLHFPLHNESQNWLRFFPSPGSRQARPVMAIGRLLLLLLLLLAIAAVLNPMFA